MFLKTIGLLITLNVAIGVAAVTAHKPHDETWRSYPALKALPLPVTPRNPVTACGTACALPLKALRPSQAPVSRSLVRLPLIAERIADCESGEWDSHGKPVPHSYHVHLAPNYAGASGKYQFMPGTWRSVTGLAPPASNYSEQVQDRAFLKLWNNGAGASNWVESRSCWS